MTEEPFNSSWIDSFAAKLGQDPIPAETITALLALAGDAARESGDRRNAPIGCFVAGLAIGRSGKDASTLAVEQVISEMK